MKKVGRNEPCPCGAKKPDGSSVKFKRCHLNKPINVIPPGLIEAYEKMKEAQTKQKSYLNSLGIYIDFVKPIEFKGKKVWALGNRVYASHSPHQTFHEFIVFIVLRHEFGEDWFRTEFQKPEAEMHFIAKCCKKYDELTIRSRSNSSTQINEHLWSTMPDGWSRSLLSLAFDIASLAHSAPNHTGQAEQLKKLIERLKNREAYQGARYEVTIAAIFARMGFILDYYDDKSTPYKHGEFIARHPASGVRLVVEAKSRHRSGVLHQPGPADDKKNTRGDVRQLLNKAVEKETDGLPFLVFIDVNSPSSDKETFDEKWSRDIVNSLGKDPLPTVENPDPYSAFVITNYSYHYQTDQEASLGQNLMVIPHFPKISIPDPSILPTIQTALNHYGNVPLIDMLPPVD
ncbi:MAG: hypothetical protein NUV84_05300 [Candidatus Uhrbacteria bacterium]|nr:hypothetical protein [Candidatus Uhrbacteria bacterium]